MIKNIISLMFHGGVDEIGGNKILLQNRGNGWQKGSVHNKNTCLFSRFVRDLKTSVTLVEKCKEYTL